MIESFFKRRRDDLADVVALREEHREALDAFFDDLLQFRRRDLGVRFDDDLAGLGVDDVVERERAFEICCESTSTSLMLGLAQLVERRACVIFLPLADDRSGPLSLMSSSHVMPTRFVVASVWNLNDQSALLDAESRP